MTNTHPPAEVAAVCAAENTPRIAVIIPTMATAPLDVAAMMAAQTIQPSQVVIVYRQSPNGYARNVGAYRVSDSALHDPVDWYLFLDDDAVFGHPECIERLYLAACQPGVAIAGAARILPDDASPFEHAVAQQVARIVNPVVPIDTRTDPDPPHYSCSITTTCCLVSRQVFEAVGGFDSTLTRGVDTEFFVRVRQLHRADAPIHLVQAGNAWVTHHAPQTMAALWHKHYAYGMGHAQEVRRDRRRARAGNYFRSPLQAAVWLLLRTILVPIHCVIPYSFGDPRWRLAWSPLKAYASYASALGYIDGWYRHDH